MTDPGFEVGEYIYKIINNKIDRLKKYLIVEIIKVFGDNKGYDITFFAKLDGDVNPYIIHYINHDYEIDKKYAVKVQSL